MKKTLYSLVLPCLVAVAVSCGHSVPKADYNVVPAVFELSMQDGKPFVLNDKVVISYDSNVPGMRRNAELLAEYVKKSTGIELAISGNIVESNAIVLETGLESDSQEAYRLSVTENSISVSGVAGSGVFYGIQTLRKSLPVGQSDAVSMPAVVISDSPRFGYRGMMLDASRHFWDVENIKTFIDMLALHNINRFHWHLTDDQGWRIEIKKYPLLAEHGSVRNQTQIGRIPGSYDGIPYGGYYTQEQLREIVQYAADRYITIIPEIDMPGHMEAVLACYPEMGCTGGPYKVRERWGISEDVLCAGNPDCMTFVKDVLTEVMDIFPSELIHIGGDECLKNRWEKCAECQRKIAELGLVTDKSSTKEQKMQRRFMEEVGEFLREHGRRMIGWDEIIEGGSIDGAVVMAWRDIDKGIDAAKKNHDVIMTPTSHFYFDYYQTNRSGEPLAIGGNLPVEKVYSFEPFTYGQSDSVSSRIMGVQANLWTEYIGTFDYVQYMVLPRMSALCEVQWAAPEHKDFDSFFNRLRKLMHIYDLYGYNYARHIFGVDAFYTFTPEGLEVDLSAGKGSKIYYTLDGSEPDAGSMLYSGTFKVGKDAVLRTRALLGNEWGPELSDTLVVNTDVHDVRLLTMPHPSYMGSGPCTLVDGFSGSENFRDGTWLGYNESDMIVDFTLKEEKLLSHVSFVNYVFTSDWIFDARKAVVYLSDNGKDFVKVAEENYPVMTECEKEIIHVHDLGFAPRKAKYVRLQVSPESSIPDWHVARNNRAFVFVDEVMFD